MASSYSETGVFRQTFTVHYPDADAAGYLRLTALMNLLQVHAGDHATELGFDYHRNKTDGVFWVLSRLSARFDTWTTWPGDLTVDTWVRPPQGLMALRDFRFGNATGWQGRASSAWVLLKGKHPQRLTEWLNLSHPVRPEEPAAEMPPLLSPFELERHAQSRAEPLLHQTHNVRADWEDIDLNNHVNNVRAIGWCLSQHDPEFLRNWRPVSLDANFLAEMFWGEAFMVVRDELAGENGCRVFDYLVVRDGDQTATLRLRMAFAEC
jgi:acyl-CoA thioesterase FadM